MLFRFDVTDGPRYGRIQRLRGNGQWAGTKRFYSRQLEREKVQFRNANLYTVPK